MKIDSSPRARMMKTNKIALAVVLIIGAVNVAHADITTEAWAHQYNTGHENLYSAAAIAAFHNLTEDQQQSIIDSLHYDERPQPHPDTVDHQAVSNEITGKLLVIDNQRRTENQHPDPNAVDLANYGQKNDPTGQPLDVEKQIQKKEAQQVAARYAAANAPRDGLNGKDGKDGKDGINGVKGDTGLTGAGGKDADMSKVNANSDAIKGDEMAEANRLRTSMQHVDVNVLAKTARDSTQKTQAETKKQIAAVQAKVAHEQQIEHTYYGQQIQQLAAEDHVDVLSESHSRAAADAQVLQKSQDYTNSKFSALKSEVDDNKKEAAAGSASAMAQANIPQVQESQQFAVGAGVGGYDSQNALSVGASFHASRSTIVKMSVSDDTQSNFGYGAGVSVGW